MARSKCPRINDRSSINFRHCPLNASGRRIRLFRFLPKAKDGKLKLHLRNNVLLSPRTRYIALSYEWGSPQQKVDIYINDHFFCVRRNLYDFLDSLYRDHYGLGLGLIWTDAICIDQENDQERCYQVQQMKQIYQGAQEVYAWLGKIEHSQGSSIRQVLKQWELSRSPDKKTWEDNFADVLSLQPELMRALHALACRPYWRRTWIIQELMLARRLRFFCCGHALEWPLWRAFYWSNSRDLEMQLHDDFQPFLAIQMYQNEFDNPRLERPEMCLLRLIMYFGNSECSLPLDRVFGFLGLTRDVDVLRVDYNILIVDLFLDVLSKSVNRIPYDELYVLTRVLQIIFVSDCDQLIMSADEAEVSDHHVTPIWQENPYPTGVMVTSTHGIDLQTRVLKCLVEWGAVKESHDFVYKAYAPAMSNEQLCICSHCVRCRTSQPWSNQTCRRHNTAFELLCLVTDEFADINDVRRLPNVYLEFQRGQYSATVIVESDALWYPPYDKIVVFQDPFYQHWEFRDGLGIFGRQTVYISLPLISAFLFLAHAFPRREKA